MKELVLNTIKLKILETDSKLLKKSSLCSFRDLFDPYCAEYQELKPNERLEIINQLKYVYEIDLMVLFHAFVALFAETRPDIARAASDGLILIIKQLQNQLSQKELLVGYCMVGFAAICKDDNLECMCGNPPYDDGIPCPKCSALRCFMTLEEQKSKLYLI